jgi:hypothetical protein
MFMGSDGGILGVGAPEVVRNDPVVLLLASYQNGLRLLFCFFCFPHR